MRNRSKERVSLCCIDRWYSDNHRRYLRSSLQVLTPDYLDDFDDYDDDFDDSFFDDDDAEASAEEKKDGE